MSTNSRKRYIRLTEIEKAVLVDDLTLFLNQVNEFLIYPTPLYELLLDERNEVFLKSLVGANNLERELTSLKNEERSTSSLNVDTFTFLRDIGQNNSLFSFEKIELFEVLDYQKYISSNLKNLVMLKYSFIYYDLYNKFYKELEKKLNNTFNSENLFDFNKTKEELLEIDYGSYKDYFSIIFQLEEDFNLNEIIIDISDHIELDKFKIALHSFDSNNFDLSDERFFDRLIQNYVNPRINLIVKSIKSIVTDILKKIKLNQSDTIQINQAPFDNYFVFAININKFKNAGNWILKDLLEKLKNNVDSVLDIDKNLETSKYFEIRPSQERLMQPISITNSLIKPFLDFYNWILIKYTEIESQDITEFSYYLKKKIKVQYFEKILEKLYSIVESYLDFCIQQHSKLISISQFPEMIEEELIKSEEIVQNDTILQLFEKLNRMIDKLNKIINHRLVKNWFQHNIINYYFTNPCIALKNSGNYLNEEIEIIEINGCEKLEFWENLTKLIQSEKMILKCEISRNYIKALYETYLHSQRIFRFDVITDEIFFNSSLMTRFHKLVNERIKNLFNNSLTATDEVKQVISALIDKKPLPYQNQEIKSALQELIENKIIKEISTYIIGI